MITNEELIMQPSKHPTMLDSCTEALRDAILNGIIGAGERVNEITFTTKLGVSRTTFRESMRKLEQSGLLIRVPYRGMFVREFSEEEVIDLNNLRAVLETYAAEIIIGKGCNKAEDLLPFYQIVSQMERIAPEEDVAQTNALHITFHRTMLNLAGNDLLFTVWNNLAQQFWMTMRISQLSLFALGEAGTFADSHREVVGAIAAGDIEQFRKVIRKHVSYFVEFRKTERGRL